MNKLTYGVWLLKRDQNHIPVLETQNFEEADKLWVELKDRWTTCLHEEKPFELRSPIITAFDPGLIYEVTVRLVDETTEATEISKNPYQVKMKKEGFSSAFRSSGDVLDGGYK
jgi:hypothetical protein